MNSNEVKLIVGGCALGKEFLDSPIKDINDINLNETVLKMKLDDANINLDDIKAKDFGMYFNVVNSGKEPYINNLNETQTLKEIIESVGDVLEDSSYDDNIVDQIEKGNLKIIGENNKKYVFNKDDLEKPFYKIIANINKFAVEVDENLPIIQFQIPTLEINQTLEIDPINNNLINQDQINNVFSNNSIEDSSKIENKQALEINQTNNNLIKPDQINKNSSKIGNNPTFEIDPANNNLNNLYQINNIYRSEIECSSESQNKPKKSSWLFKLLISLAIIFAVLSILAFALEFALALKIIFVVVAVICSIGSIVSGFVNRCKKGNPVSTDLNGYGPNILNDPNQDLHQYQYPSQYPSQNLNNQY